MCRYFKVVEYRDGGHADVFDKMLRRARETEHFDTDRRSRYERILHRVGFGHAVRLCLVDTGHPAGREVHVLTSTGVVVVFNERTRRLVTMLVARPGQVARYYAPFGEEPPRRLYHRAYENTCVHHWNY